jgi:hypothetical protein
MEPLSDSQRIELIERNAERLEKKVDDGFAETKAEFRSVRAEIGGIQRSIQAMWLTMTLGFAGLFLTMVLGLGGILVQHL